MRRRRRGGIIDQIGEAVGVTYQEGEPLRIGQKEHERDEHRWELDPASAEDYPPQLDELREAERILHMEHHRRHR